jgi:tetratricopeptide (TPR) repeat protein
MKRRAAAVDTLLEVIEESIGRRLGEVANSGGLHHALQLSSLPLLLTSDGSVRTGCVAAVPGGIYVKRVPDLLALVLLSVAILQAQSTNTPGQTENHVRELLSEGTRLLAESKVDAALDDFRQAHSLAPDDVDAIIGLARAEALHTDKSGSPDMQTEAQEHYQEVLSKQPTTELYVELYSERGWANFTKGDCSSLSLAESDFSKAVSLEPQNADLHFRLGGVFAAEGVEGLKCAHSEQERTAFIQHAWSQYQSAVNLDHTNVQYREGFVLLSDVLKRKPEYAEGTAKQVDNPSSDFPLTLNVDNALVLNFAEKNPEALFQADEMGMAPPIHVIVYASLNGENHWRFTCHRENSHGERNPCTKLAPGSYPARWIHNRELLQILIKEGDAFGWRFLDVEAAPESPANQQDNVLRSESYQFTIRKPEDKGTTEYPMLIHVYGAAKFRLPNGSLPARSHCSATSYTSYRTDVDCTNSGAVQLYKGFVTVEAAIDGNSEWWISCDAKWRWSKCSVLGPGFYPARWKDGPGSRLVVLAVENDKPHEVTFEAKQMPNLREPAPAQPPSR